ncbi:MAG: hypothetical protein DMF87_27945, partial [Acidobacteria bacterium]
MLPRELVEELISGPGLAGLHVVVASADAFDGFLIVLALPFEIVDKEIVKRVGSALAAATGEILELRQSLGFHRHRFHVLQYPMSSQVDAFSYAHPIVADSLEFP